MSFDRNLKTFMQLKKVSQTSLAETLKVSPQAVQQWCAGKTRPDIKRIKKIAEVLGTSPDVLLYEFSYLDSEKEPFYPDVENEDDENLFSERLAFALTQSKQPIEAIAERIGVSPEQLLDWTKTDFPSEISLKKLAEALGVSVRWLAIGEGRPEALTGEVVDGASSSIEIEALKAKEIPEEFMMVRSLNFNEKMLMRLCPQADPSQLAVFGVHGDSMSPTLPEGSLALIDLSVTKWEADSLYVVGFRDVVTLKRVQKLPSNIIRLINDNPCYPSFDIDLKDDNADFKVFGRVIHFWKNGR